MPLTKRQVGPRQSIVKSASRANVSFVRSFRTLLDWNQRRQGGPIRFLVPADRSASCLLTADWPQQTFENRNASHLFGSGSRKLRRTLVSKGGLQQDSEVLFLKFVKVTRARIL